jgi:hypothetical protein
LTSEANAASYLFGGGNQAIVQNLIFMVFHSFFKNPQKLTVILIFFPINFFSIELQKKRNQKYQGKENIQEDSSTNSRP